MIQDLRFKNNAGLTLVEVVIASAIILTATLALLSIHSFYFKTTLSNVDKAKAAYLAEEALEAVRYLRDISWDTNIAPLAQNTNYGIVFWNNTWQASTTATSIQNFTRTIRLSSVYRDSNSDIVYSGGTLDPDTRSE